MRRPQRSPSPGWLSSARTALPARRRLFPLVGLLLIVLLAGCSAPGSLTMDSVTDRDIADEASRSFDLPAGEDGDDAEARMLRSAVENGSGTLEARSPPIRDGLPFEYRGAYYDLSWTVVGERTATSVSLVVDYNDTDPEGRRIAYEDLPAVDRRALESLIPPEGRHAESGESMGTVSTYDDAEVEKSVFVPEPRYDVVVHDGEAYAVEPDGTRAVTLNTYRYTSMEVAGSPEEYARDLEEEHLFALSGLPEGERSIVETAVEEGSYYAEDDDEAFGALVERFRRHEAVVGEDTHGEWLVRYEGETYWAGLEYGGYGGGDGAETSGSGAETER